MITRQALPLRVLWVSLWGCLLSAGCEPTSGVPGAFPPVGGAADAGATADGAVIPSADIQVPLSDAAGTTQPGETIKAQPIAGICAKDSDCVDGYCNADFPGGYCSALCASHDDCPGNAKCYPDIIPAGPKMCWKLCSSPNGCRLDQICEGVCTPKCPGLACNAGYACDEDSGQCVPVGQASTCEPMPEVCDQMDNDCDGVTDQGCGPDLVEGGETTLITDLGLVQVGGDGLSEELTFSVSSAAGSFTILLIDMDDSNEVMAVYQLFGPDGAALVTATDPQQSPILTFPEVQTLAVQVPNTPTVSVSSGVHRFTVYREGDVGHAWVYVIQTLRKEQEYSHMDVNFWFVGTPGLTSTTCQSKSKFMALQNTFVQTMQSHGVLIDNISYFDVTGSDAQKYTIVDTSSDGYTIDEHSELLALSSALPNTNRGVNFFFVQGFNGWGLLGKAGGIPGPPLYHGSYASGVVVSLVDYYEYELQIGIPVTAETMAHELGHQLGLYHTSEQSGGAHDPIPDTPECTDTNGDGIVDFEECAGKGANNLMFWSVTLSAKLTPGQKHVIHRNASLY